MANNYRGYFYGIDDCEHRYRVEFIVDSSQNAVWEEITLAGGSPCVVTYDTQNSPFEPLMVSHMAVEVISDDWLFDLYSQDVHSCKAYLYRELAEGEIGRETTVWAGFVTNNLLNMPQDMCMNTFTVNCDDCLATLDQYDYRLKSVLDTTGDYKQIVTFADILRNIGLTCELISAIVVDKSVIDTQYHYVEPAELKISEQNFFSSDIDEEPWKMSEVLEEMCRWLGMTAIQHGTTLYIMDRQSHTNTTWYGNNDNDSSYNVFRSQKPFSSFTSSTYAVKNIAYREDNVGGSGSNISLETVYNSVQVRDSFYEIDDFIPDLYDDDYLTNYDGDRWTSLHINCGNPAKPQYLNKKAQVKEDADDSVNDYYMKQWQHKWYTPQRYIPPYNEPALYADLYPHMDDTSYTGTIQAMTSYTVSYTIKNRSRFTKHCKVYLVEHYGFSGNGTWYMENTVEQNLTWEPWEEKSVELTLTGFHQGTSDLSPRFKMGNGAWTALAFEGSVYGMPTSHNVTAEIVDMAVVGKAKDSSFYDRQIADTITWDRHLMIAQLDTPNELVNPRNLTRQEAWLTYPSLMSLNSGYHNPMILDSNAFIAINGKVKVERYKRQYINPEWTGDATGIGGDYNCSYWGIITGTKEIYTFPLALWFKLKIGNYYWNGTAWSTDYSLFYVDVSTNVDEDGYIDFSKIWNTDFNILNNISYTTYSGASGYKIPLDPTILDFNNQIEFSINLPSRVQQYTGSTTHDGMNSYVYVDDLSIVLYTKGSEKAELADVIYENDPELMNNASNNTLSEITCRFTTYPNEGQHSYSNVGYGSVLADLFRKYGLGFDYNKMEENIIKAYVNQYGTNTISETVVMDMTPTVLSRVKDTDMDKYFHVTGMQIDYANASQTINLVESKIYPVDD